MIEAGDLVDFLISPGSSTWMRGRVYAILQSGLVIVVAGQPSRFYDCEPQDVRKI